MVSFFSLLPSATAVPPKYSCAFDEVGRCPYTNLKGKSSSFVCDAPAKGVLKVIAGSSPTSYKNLPDKSHIKNVKKKLRSARKSLKATQALMKALQSNGNSIPKSLKKELAARKLKVKNAKSRLNFTKECLNGTLSLAFDKIGQDPPPGDEEPSDDEVASAIEVVYDVNGIPHISANTDKDLFYALGWLHATHRSFQIVLRRAQAEGRAAELFGPELAGADLVFSDRKFRTFDLTKVAIEAFALFPDFERSLLTSYAAGVNSVFTSYTEQNLPLAFKSTGVKSSEIEPWLPEHSLLVQMVFSDLFAGGYANELLNEQRFNQDVATFGLEQTVNTWLNPPRIPEGCIINENPLNMAGMHLSLPERDPLFANANHMTTFIGPLESIPVTTASHGVVVAKGPGGAPAILSQPRLAVDHRDLGSVVLSGPSHNVQVGMIFGAPFALIGSGKNVAWTLTSAHADSADLFTLQMDPNNPNNYLLDGVSTPFEMREEMIKVKGEPSQPLVVRESFFGPLVTQEFGINTNRPYALKHIFREERSISTTPHSLLGWMRMLRAKSLSDVEQAVKKMNYPFAHMLVAVRESSSAPSEIGYFSTAGVAKRSSRSLVGGLIPQDGSQKVSDWVGMLPESERPSITNPVSGYLVAANNCTSSNPEVNIHYDSGVGNTARGYRLKQRVQSALADDGQVDEGELYEAMTNCDAIGIQEFRSLFEYIQQNFPELLPAGNPNLDHAIQILLSLPENPSETPLEPSVPYLQALASSSISNSRQLDYAEQYAKSPSALWRFYDEFTANPELAFDLSPFREDFVHWVVLSLEQAFLKATAPVSQGGYGDPSSWMENYPDGYVIKWAMSRLSSDSINQAGDITVNFLPCAPSTTLWSQESVQHDYIQILDGSGIVKVIPGPGIDANEPSNPRFRDQVLKWSSGELQTVSLDFTALKAGCPKCEQVILEPNPSQISVD